MTYFDSSFTIHSPESLGLCIRSSAGVQSLAALLMELQPGGVGPHILAADALYQLGRVEEAYRLLLSIGTINPRGPTLARLALLQLHRGFLYDTNQVCLCKVMVNLTKKYSFRRLFTSLIK